MRSHTDVLDVLQRADCRYIELFMNQSFIDLPIATMEKEISRRNLEVLSIHLPLAPFAYERNESEEFWINRGLKYLDVLGANMLVTHFHHLRNDSKANNDESHLELLRRHTPLTSRIICTENLPVHLPESLLHDMDGLARFLKENSCHVTFDTTHCATMGGDLIQDFRKLKDHVRNIHLSDFSAGVEHLVLGTGDLPLKDFIEELVVQGYKHPLTLEYDFENRSRNRIDNYDQAIEAIRGSMDFVKSVIEESAS